MNQIEVYLTIPNRLKQVMSNQLPWELTSNIENCILKLIPLLDDNYIVQDNVAIHKSAIIENNVVLKGPIIVEKECFIGANSYLRNGVYLDESVSIGAGCEIKSSYILKKSAIAHFNFIGNSVIGSSVNFEAGAVVANHYNEREVKRIFVKWNQKKEDTKVDKFGALVGDFSKIGANAVLSPGTILPKHTIVKRLELVE